MRNVILKTYSANYNTTLKRILVSKQIRRLKGKKQVFSLIEPSSNVKYDYVHERLIHTIEVESIAHEIISRICDRNYRYEDGNSQILIKLCFSKSLLDSIAFSHDFGHTPFGHVGEVALTDYMIGKNNQLSMFKRKNIDDSYLPMFKHNYYSATLLYRNFVGCGPDIIDGVLKHSSTIKFNGENIDNVNAFGSYSYLPMTLRSKHNYLQVENSYTLEGQVVAIADEVAQMLSDIEDSKIVFQASFVKGDIKNSVLQNYSETLKEYLMRIRRYFINEIVNNSILEIQKYLDKNYKAHFSNIYFYDKVVDFGMQAKPVFKELETLRAVFLHGNEMVKIQNCTSYLIIYKIFDYYLEDINHLFKNDRKSMDYISENFARIRNKSYQRKLNKKSVLTRFESFYEYVCERDNKIIVAYLNNVIVPNQYISKTISQERAKELGGLCNYIIHYFLNNYGENNLLDNLSRSLLREISFSVAKMTDRYAINLFYKTFGKHFVKLKVSKYVKNSCKRSIVTKQFEMKKDYSKKIRKRLKIINRS